MVAEDRHRRGGGKGAKRKGERKRRGREAKQTVKKEKEEGRE